MPSRSGSRSSTSCPHEAHFAEVTERFLAYLKDPASIASWESANQLAKYRITTEAFELSRR